ncbi:MAG: response regulator [Pseudomonadota bacterium]
MKTVTALFVDDETSILNAVKRLCRKTDLNVLLASSGEEALDILDEHRVDIVVSDQRMPGMLGTDFLKEVGARYPDTVRCILSGYAEMDSVVAAINDGNVYRFMAKPWDDKELLGVLEDCVARTIAIARERETQTALKNRKNELEQESAEFAELIRLQESLLNSSRHLLDQLPVGVAVLDEQSRMIYLNGVFLKRFGESSGVAIGEFSGQPWADLAAKNFVGTTDLDVGEERHSADVSQIEIGGHMHTIIAIAGHRIQ